VNLRVDVLYDHGMIMFVLRNAHKNAHTRTRTGKMAGGVVYEYYQKSGCGIISYFCVSSAHRGKGYGTLLVCGLQWQMYV
jgi:predicted GNAT family acetyltransferase